MWISTSCCSLCQGKSLKKYRCAVLRSAVLLRRSSRRQKSSSSSTRRMDIGEVTVIFAPLLPRQKPQPAQAASAVVLLEAEKRSL
ncbi:hypothetical protein EON64_05300 [archaeon]|nr:MAG: hypothetical protein EON64_05300 [archaeon]